MIYLDSGATSFYKPETVYRGVLRAMQTCANPGRGGYMLSLEAARVVGKCRELCGEMFDCLPENVVFTFNCTHGLNIAIRSLVKPGDRVVVSGFEHNAVMRPLKAIGAQIIVAGRKLFDREDTLADFEAALKKGVAAAVFTHVSNVFGYVLPVEKMAALCRAYQVPFIIDAAQSAGVLPVKLRSLGAEFIAMPGHKGLLGPQGTGVLLCNRLPDPILYGGTGSVSRQTDMPDFLPDRAEAGTLNVPGIAGLHEGLRFLKRTGLDTIAAREKGEVQRCAQGLSRLGMCVFTGEDQCSAVSFVPEGDCEEFAQKLARKGVAVRAGIHCAPLAHESAGTLATGTVRVSYGYRANGFQTKEFLEKVAQVM